MGGPTLHLQDGASQGLQPPASAVSPFAGGPLPLDPGASTPRWNGAPLFSRPEQLAASTKQEGLLNFEHRQQRITQAGQPGPSASRQSLLQPESPACSALSSPENSPRLPAEPPTSSATAPPPSIVFSPGNRVTWPLFSASLLHPVFSPRWGSAGPAARFPLCSPLSVL